MRRVREAFRNGKISESTYDDLKRKILANEGTASKRKGSSTPEKRNPVAKAARRDTSKKTPAATKRGKSKTTTPKATKRIIPTAK